VASTDEPQNIKIGGAGRKFWVFLVPTIILIISIAVTFFFPNSIPPGSLAITPNIDPASGSPLLLEPMALILQSIVNGVTYGGITLIIGAIVALRRR